MTMFEFAIARRFNQLRVARRTRVMNQAEWQLLGRLGPVVERYEESEMYERPLESAGETLEAPQPIRVNQKEKNHAG